MKLLLAPHFDDESLFAAYICLREQPDVLFCFDGAPRHGSFETRWAEARQATRHLGVTAVALRATPETLADHLAAFDPEHVWAPWPEPGGNSEHNLVGDIASGLWPDRISYYTTYAESGRTTEGRQLDAEPGWAATKARALACYGSQLDNPGTRPHFERAFHEYVIEPAGVLL